MGTRGYRYKTSHSQSGPGDGGRTGSWRVQRPVIDLERCTPAKRGAEACFICWLYCPDCVISRTIPPDDRLRVLQGLCHLRRGVPDQGHHHGGRSRLAPGR